jgi:hypothetical protein
MASCCCLEVWGSLRVHCPHAPPRIAVFRAILSYRTGACVRQALGSYLGQYLAVNCEPIV